MKSSRGRSWWRWLAVVGVFAIVAVACDTGTEPATTVAPDTTAAPATTEAPTTETTAAPVAEGFTYKVAIFEDITTDNIWASLDTDNTVWVSYVIGAQPAALYTLALPAFTLVPSLAADTVPPVGAAAGDDWVIDVAMIDTATWSDGTPITAHDVAFSVNTSIDLVLGGNFIALYPTAADDDPATEEDEFTLGIRSAEAISDYEVRFTFNGQPGLPVWQFGAAQGPVMQQAFWEEHATSLDVLYGASGEGAPSASGMVFAGGEAGAFARNTAVADFWDKGSGTSVYSDGSIIYTNPQSGVSYTVGAGGGEIIAEYTEGPFASEAIYSIYGTQDAAVLALKDGEVDFMLNPLGLQRGLQGLVLESDDLDIISNSSLGFRYLSFNTRRVPFNDMTARRSIACMIDKDFMANNVLQGVAIPVNSLVPAGVSFWYNPDIVPWCDGLTEAERAMESVRMLTEAGYTWDVEPVWDPDNLDIVPKGEGMRMPDGTLVPEMTLLAPGPGYDPLRATYSLFIADWASSLGFPMTAEPTGFNVIVDAVFGPTDWDAYILGWGIGTFPDHVPEFFESSKDSADGGFNTPGYNNPEFDALAAEFNASTDVDEAAGLIKKMDFIIADEVPYVTLFTTPILEAFRTTLEFPFTSVLGGIQRGPNGAPTTVKLAS